MTRGALIAAVLLATVLSVVGTPPRPSVAAFRAPSNPLQPMDPTPTDLPQSWVAGFKVSGHWFHAGDRVTGTITVKAGRCMLFAPPCYTGTDWSIYNLRCPNSSLTCSWHVRGNSVPHWVYIDMPIFNKVGPAHSVDYYAVTDKNVLDGHVTDNAGDPFAGVTISIAGPRSGTVTTDKAGYYYAVLPRGTYRVTVDAGNPAGTRDYHPQTKSVTLHGFKTVDFVGSIHTTINLSRRTVSGSGLETATLTVHAESPVGQPLVNHPIRVDVSPKFNAKASFRGNAFVDVCSAMPGYTGRIAPQSLNFRTNQGDDAITQPTDKNGTLTYQVYFGANPGEVTFSAEDANTLGMLPVDNSYTSMDAFITPANGGSWRALYSVVEPLANGKSIVHLSLAGALTAIVQGLTAPRQVNQTVPTPVNLGGATGDAQKALLRAIEQSHVFDGLGLAPVEGFSGPGGLLSAAPHTGGVLIYVPNYLPYLGPNSDSETVVLDIDTATALQHDTIAHADTAVHLPTLNAWSRNILFGGTGLPGYASTVPEQGLTYGTHYLYGLPYLPVADADLATFDATCINRAPSL